MSVEGNVEIENAETVNTSNDEDAQDPEVSDEQQISLTDCTSDITPKEKIQDSKTEDVCDDEILEGLSSEENISDRNESRWCDNYSFAEDDKCMTEFNEKDPKMMILWAAEKNELETLRKLLEEDPSLVHSRDDDLYTPLHRASYNNNVEVITILLSYDADISAKTVDGWQPLHCACKWDSVEAVSLLIQNGADVNAQTNGHITPLHLAASNVSGRRTLELLLWHPHIDPNIKNNGGDTAYEIACRSGPLGALFEILEESVNVY